MFGKWHFLLKKGALCKKKGIQLQYERLDHVLLSFFNQETKWLCVVNWAFLWEEGKGGSEINV